MSMVEFEASNLTLPLKNSPGMRCIAVLRIDLTSASFDLRNAFAKLDNGHFLSIVPDMHASTAKCYIAFGGAAGTIDETATTGINMCYVKGDLQELSGRLIGGNESYTGWSTGVSYPYIHYKASGTTGLLRIYRSSTASGQGPGESFPITPSWP